MCARDGGRRQKALTSSGGRLAGVDVADDDDVDMSLLLTVQLFVSTTEVAAVACKEGDLSFVDLPHGERFLD